MSKLLPVVLVFFVLLAGGYYFFITRNNSQMGDSSTSTTASETMDKTDSTMTDSGSMDSSHQTNPDTAVSDSTAAISRYIDYSPAAFAAANSTRRVLFFYAAWCPTCRPADAQFSSHTNEIPADVTLFRVNYDTETDLKNQYDITYQHTFVLVDANGAALSRWNGSTSISELLSHL